MLWFSVKYICLEVKTLNQHVIFRILLNFDFKLHSNKTGCQCNPVRHMYNDKSNFLSSRLL